LLNLQEVLAKLSNKPIEPSDQAHLQLIIDENTSLDLLVGADSNYVEKPRRPSKALWVETLRNALVV
jgi:hypothetical protein